MPSDHAPLLAIFDAAVASLASALDWYWPTYTNYEVAEATPLQHVGNAFAGAGFRVFAEVPDHSKRTRLDLLALRFGDAPMVVAVEGKRLWNGGQGWAVASDMRRLRSLTLPQGLPSGAECFGCVVATTWKRHVAAWWADSRRPPTPKGGSSAGWEPLRSALADVDASVAKPIYRGRTEGQSQQFLLLTVERLEGVAEHPSN